MTNDEKSFISVTGIKFDAFGSEIVDAFNCGTFLQAGERIQKNGLDFDVTWILKPLELNMKI
ncbi:hypothetical protein [Lacrimispora sp.]|uniref:hypothetical protein n=1 Tax=Lacrimispora sp. TaxID=2719234 RepID=UPI0028B03942|nr:hypothetical protein [Lacrimispora sp.]